MPAEQAPRFLLTVDRPLPVRVGFCGRQGLATIAREEAGQVIEAAVQIGAVVPAPGYAAVFQDFVGRYVQRDAVIPVRGSGIGLGAFQELPIVELMIRPGHSLSAELLARGWALPHAAAWQGHQAREELATALAQARSDEAGIWGESRPAHELLSEAWLQASLPPPRRSSAWLHDQGPLLLLVLLLVLLGGHAAGSRSRRRRLWPLLFGLPCLSAAPAHSSGTGPDASPVGTAGTEDSP